MLQNAYLLAKIGADTAENEQHFAEILPIARRLDDLDTARGGGTPSSEGRQYSLIEIRAPNVVRHAKM